MNQKINESSDSLEPPFPANDHSFPARFMWRRDGAFIMDGTGKKVAAMQGKPAGYELYQRRIVAAVNAMQDTPTPFIEEFVKDSQEDNVILELLTRDRQMAATLKRMEERITAHRREIAQLREMMDMCRVFEEQRAILQQRPGAAEYEALLRTLGMR